MSDLDGATPESVGRRGFRLGGVFRLKPEATSRCPNPVSASRLRTTETGLWNESYSVGSITGDSTNHPWTQSVYFRSSYQLSGTFGLRTCHLP
jgi:hypothetical protein